MLQGFSWLGLGEGPGFPSMCQVKPRLTPPSPCKTPPLCIGAGMEGVGITGVGGTGRGCATHRWAKHDAFFFGCLRARLIPTQKSLRSPSGGISSGCSIPRASQGQLAFVAIFIFFLQQKQEAMWKWVLLGSGEGEAGRGGCGFQELVGSPEALSGLQPGR